MISVNGTSKAVLLCRPIVGEQKARITLHGVVHYGPFTFGAHAPVDGSRGVVFTELNSGTAVAFGEDDHQALTMLRHRLENETVTTFIVRCQLAVDHKKQDLSDLRAYRHEMKWPEVA